MWSRIVIVCLLLAGQAWAQGQGQGQNITVGVDRPQALEKMATQAQMWQTEMATKILNDHLTKVDARDLSRRGQAVFQAFTARSTSDATRQAVEQLLGLGARQ